jgi:hypothetical protein
LLRFVSGIKTELLTVICVSFLCPSPRFHNNIAHYPCRCFEMMDGSGF